MGRLNITSLLDVIWTSFLPPVLLNPFDIGPSSRHNKSYLVRFDAIVSALHVANPAWSHDYLGSSLSRFVGRHGAEQIASRLKEFCEHYPVPLTIEYIWRCTSLVDHLRYYTLLAAAISKAGVLKGLIQTFWIWKRTEDEETRETHEDALEKRIVELVKL